MASRPVRVVHVLEATEGGTQRWLENVVAGLDPARVHCGVICSVRRNASFAETAQSFHRGGTPVWLVDMRRAVSPWHDAAAVLRIASILRRERFDVIHAHSAKAGMLARLAARMTGRHPVVYTPHAFPFLARHPLRGVYRVLERAARPLTDVLLAVSDAERYAALAIGYASARVVTIANGVEPGVIAEASGERKHVGAITWFRDQKDPETFIRACAMLRLRDLELRFSIYGDGPGLESARALSRRYGLESALDFPGYVADARAHMRDWSVFVCSTHYEGLSYALLEAMAAGKAIVATRVPGVEEAIVHEQTGLLVPESSPHLMAAAIRRLLEDPAFARRLGAAARSRALERYGLARQLEELSVFYERLQEGGRACS